VLIIALLKGVPARTTALATVGGVLKREEMEIVLNPYDAKAIEAADFVRSRVGGKTVAMSMGPDIKLAPLMKPLYRSEVYGIDESYILSDRKMAGADTLATSYAVCLGILKLVARHTQPVDELASMVGRGADAHAVSARAKELYAQNLLPNAVYSDLPTVRDSIVQRLETSELGRADAVRLLIRLSERLSRFVVLAGVKSTDGETGSVGPQVAESLAESLPLEVPHLTYVHDFDIDPVSLKLSAGRKIGRLLQTVKLQCPAVITVSPEYERRDPDPSGQPRVRENNYRGKVAVPVRWSADDLGADPSRLGLPGSPTVVGPGLEIGKRPEQKVIGRSFVFAKRMEGMQVGMVTLAPYSAGDLADSVPEPLLSELKAKGIVVPFTFEMFKEEVLPR
jgi:electron transfer flavoprotein beta subunit